MALTLLVAIKCPGSIYLEVSKTRSMPIRRLCSHLKCFSLSKVDGYKLAEIYCDPDMRRHRCPYDEILQDILKVHVSGVWKQVDPRNIE